MAWLEPVVLQGKIVALELLAHKHCGDLTEAVSDGALHKLWYTTVPAPDEMELEIERRLQLWDAGDMLPFAVVERKSGEAVGMTTYINIDAAHKRVEIGSTWYRRSAQRSGINTECKFLMLRRAFEELDCIAVELRTHFSIIKDPMGH